MLHLENAAEKLFSDSAKTLKLILRKFRVLYKNVWVVQNSKPVTDRLDQIKPKQNANLIPKFSLGKGKGTICFDFGFHRGSKKKKMF